MRRQSRHVQVITLHVGDDYDVASSPRDFARNSTENAVSPLVSARVDGDRPVFEGQTTARANRGTWLIADHTADGVDIEGQMRRQSRMALSNW